MSTERTYLTLDDAIFIHDEQIRLYGGAPGIRDEGLILSALLRPATGYYADVIEEAAALWESLAMNHGFVDGNKRVALACTFVFLGLNGVGVEADADEVISFILGHLEAGTFQEACARGVAEAAHAPSLRSGSTSAAGDEGCCRRRLTAEKQSLSGPPPLVWEVGEGCDHLAHARR